MIPPDLKFDLDIASYLLIGAVCIIFLFKLLNEYRKQALENFDTSLIIGRSQPVFWIKVAALALAWILLVFAFMQPVGNEHYADEATAKAFSQIDAKGKLHKRGHEVFLFIDTSASMDVPDTSNGGSRLAKAKSIADQIIRRLDGQNVALYAFTSSTTQLSPATLDYLFVRLMLRQMKINEGDVGGTDFAPLLKTLKSNLLTAPPASLKSAIIFSDGGDYRLDKLKGRALQEAITGLTNELSNSENERLRVFTVGIGSKEGGTIPGVTDNGQKVHSSLEDLILKKLALKGRGDYFSANQASDIEIAAAISSAMRQDPSTISESELLASLASNRNDKLYDLYFQVPLAFALILLAYFLFWPEVKR